jgi:hypothetical protein
VPGGSTLHGKRDLPLGELPDKPLDGREIPRYTAEVPVIVGHYWQTGTPTLLGPKAACVDYSAGAGGPLVAYRWHGEADLDASHFVAC